VKILTSSSKASAFWRLRSRSRAISAAKSSAASFSPPTANMTLSDSEGLGQQRSGADACCRESEVGWVTINLEIVNRFESNLLNTAAQGLAFIRDAGSDNIYLHLDTFHMNIEEADPAQAILLTGDRLGYFHVGESHRGYLGSGTIDFPKTFDALVAAVPSSPQKPKISR